MLSLRNIICELSLLSLQIWSTELLHLHVYALINVFQVAVGDYHKRISYAYFTGFISLLNNMELMKKIYLSASRQDKNAPCSKGTSDMSLSEV